MSPFAFHSVFDVRSTPLWPYALVLAVGLVVGVWQSARAWRSLCRGGGPFFVVWWTGVTLLGGVGFGNVVYQRHRCQQWLAAGDVEVVEGRVERFVPMPEAGHAHERFTVGGHDFRTSSADLSTGAFNQTAREGGPIRAGRLVRLTHHHGRILRVEVADEPLTP